MLNKSKNISKPDDVLTTYRVQFQQLCCLKDQINQTFSFQLLLTLCSTFFQVVCGVFTFITSANIRGIFKIYDHQLVFIATFVVFESFKIFAIGFECHTMMQQMENTSDVIHAYMTDTCFPVIIDQVSLTSVNVD